MIQTNTGYTFCVNLETVADCGAVVDLKTISIYHHHQFNVMLLTIPAGHTLKGHVSSKMVTLQIISGTGSVSLENKTQTVKRGAWFAIAPYIPHEIVSDETLTVLLSMYTLVETH